MADKQAKSSEIAAPKGGGDLRSRRSRAALVAAFDRLFLQRKAADPAAVAAEAGTARSTFYKHFRGSEGIAEEALRRILVPLADAAAGLSDETQLADLLAHCRQYRREALTTLEGRGGLRVERLLAEMIGELSPSRGRLDSLRRAGGSLALLRAWLAGHPPASAVEIIEALRNSGVSDAA